MVVWDELRSRRARLKSMASTRWLQLLPARDALKRYHPDVVALAYHVKNVTALACKHRRNTTSTVLRIYKLNGGRTTVCKNPEHHFLSNF